MNRGQFPISFDLARRLARSLMTLAHFFGSTDSWQLGPASRRVVSSAAVALRSKSRTLSPHDAQELEDWAEMIDRLQ